MYKMLHEVLPEVGMSETRTVTVLPDSDQGLPVGEYGFGEMYCIDPGCDCRRVIFKVLCSPIDEESPAYGIYDIRGCEQIIEPKICATIGWGWESRKHYENWMNSKDPKLIDDAIGPYLDPLHDQSPLAPAVLELFKDALLKDELYVERIKRHYSMFRKAIGQKKSTTKVSRGSNVTPKKKKRKKRK